MHLFKIASLTFEPCPFAAYSQNPGHPQQTKETRDAHDGQRYKPAGTDVRNDINVLNVENL